jgi:hypothetical protein
MLIIQSILYNTYSNIVMQYCIHTLLALMHRRKNKYSASGIGRKSPSIRSGGFIVVFVAVSHSLICRVNDHESIEESNFLAGKFDYIPDTKEQPNQWF